MLTPQFVLPLAGELVVDLFAGGGGASTGIEQAIGRHVDIAINHDADAIGMHEANHPQTRHYHSDAWEVDPVAVTDGRPVGLLHASPDCTDHSQAKGGQPRSKATRSLAWVVHRWAGKVRPDIITLENVEQMLRWSNLVAKRDPATGRVVTLDVLTDPATGKRHHRVADPGERVPLRNQFLVPDEKRLGTQWKRFVQGLRDMGYTVQWRVICNADLGAHSTRTRLYMIARRDGLPIVWPEQTHAKRPVRGLQRHRPASDCIDWTIEGKSIFDRKKPLADATLRRIAYGLKRFVLDCPEPFIVNMAHGGKVEPISAPFSTIATEKGGCRALVSPVLVQMGYGEREGQAPRALDIHGAVGTVTAGGNKFGLAAAFMVQANGGFNTTPARDLRGAMSTVTTTGSQQQLVTATLSREHEEGALRCAAFLINYYGNGQPLDLRDGMPTVTTHDRMALVTVWLKGEPWVIVDITLRMLVSRELYRAQDFPDDYIIEKTAAGKMLTKTAQVRMCGNSVSPLPMSLIVGANWSAAEEIRRAA